MKTNNIPGMKKPELHALPQVKERLTFIYLERCIINREEGAITVKDKRGVIHIPAASVCAILLGPGTNITHRAMELIGDSGVTLVWVGEQGVRYYASGRPLTHSSTLLMCQSKFASNKQLHLEVAKKMYQMRFPNEDVSSLTMQQLRGKEGARVRAIYKKYSQQYNLDWTGREFNPDDFLSGSIINQALSSGNVCLYGLAQAVISALGCSPGLGFVHIGHERSFVYDIADLYKAETVIPLAFKLTSEGTEDCPRAMRRCMRDIFVKNQILERMVNDIHYLLSEKKFNENQIDVVYLWDNGRKPVQNGISY